MRIQVNFQVFSGDGHSFCSMKGPLQRLKITMFSPVFLSYIRIKKHVGNSDVMNWFSWRVNIYDDTVFLRNL